MHELTKKAFLLELREQFDALYRAISDRELCLNLRLRKRLGKLKAKIETLYQSLSCHQQLSLGEVR